MLHRIPQIALGIALSAGLVAFGFAVTGTRIGALSPAQGPSGLPPLEGSRAVHSTVLVDGEPTRVSDCSSRSAPGMVLARYEAIARTESAAREAPYLLQTDETGSGALVWTAPDGTRRAVLANRDALGGTRYKLIEAPPMAIRAERDVRRKLPAGVDPPAGAEVVLSVERPGGGGFAMMRVRASPVVAADRCLTALAAQGIVAEPTAREVLSGQEGPITRPLVDATGAARGVLVVAADEAGGARASLTLE